jgi:hypothetical protein
MARGFSTAQRSIPRTPPDNDRRAMVVEHLLRQLRGCSSMCPACTIELLASSGYDSTMLIHSVYFWFKTAADPEVVERFAQGLAKLTTISSVHTGYYGKPEATPKRPVIDDSYDWALVLSFTDLAAHDHYQEHPIHTTFVEEFSSSWEEVRVYDVRT